MIKIDELEKITDQDAEFIAAARKYMPKLIAIARAAKNAQIWVRQYEDDGELFDALEALEKE